MKTISVGLAVLLVAGLCLLQPAAQAAPPPPPGSLDRPPLNPVDQRQIALGRLGITPCTAPTGVGTTHNSITAASPMSERTWTEAGSPHVLPYDINISVPVSVESCAVIRIAAGRTITIQPGGALNATGQRGRPVTIEPLAAGMAWAQIRVTGGALSLTKAVILGGGALQSTPVAYTAALRLQSGTLHVDDVEIIGSKSQGVYINNSTSGFDATSQNLRIHGSVGFPVHVFAGVIGSVPSGQYTGNGRDAIGIAGTGGPVGDAQTLHNRGVPYHVGSGQDGGRMDVNASGTGATAVLSIEPGVTIQFPPGGTLYVAGRNAPNGAAHGALVAIGSGAPIIFTSDQGASPAAGSWLGIKIGDPVDPRTALQNVKVMFAGAADITGSNSCPYPGSNVGNNAAIRILGAPAAQFITNSEIIASASFGIDRGWRSDMQPDFLGSNVFTAVTSCKQSTPRMANGNCPVQVPCP